MMNRKPDRPPGERAAEPGSSEMEPGAAPESTRRLLAAWPDREEALAGRLRDYVGYLLRQNRRFNLTGDRESETQWRAHVEDALKCGEIIQACEGGSMDGRRVLDVGSGGGVPGLIWALLWPGARVTLVEATAKKARFLEAAAGLLGLGNVRVLARRAEELAHEPAHRESYDVVTARALAALPALAEWTVPFLKTGGRLCAIKGPEVGAEIEQARSAFSALGAAEEPEIVPYRRGDGRDCHLLIYAKQRPTPKTYPRRGGATKRRPL